MDLIFVHLNTENLAASCHMDGYLKSIRPGAVKGFQSLYAYGFQMVVVGKSVSKH